jgi:arsenite methyltransferase
MPDEMASITDQVSERYARAVTTGEQMCCPTGYNFEDLRTFIPEEVLKVSYGCGTPAGLDTVRLGETVLDIGSGGGIDCFEASRRVGPEGQVIGIDMTEEMLALARRHAPTVAANLRYGRSNVEFRKGMTDAMPVADASIDLIISNCVINLAPDKPKVFCEMLRVLRAGGRFTISDIVSDQPVPNYLVHDPEKWGDCLSGALQVGDYMAKMVEAGFLGIHQLKTVPWRVIDGIHFFSITLTGYKLSMEEGPDETFATLLGPFRAATDELGQTYRRGTPRRIDARTAQLLRTPTLKPLFMVSDSPAEMVLGDSRLCSVLPEQVLCVWKGDYAMLTGPFREVCDDDQHIYRRGEPTEICSKTLDVLSSDRYRPHFAVINRASTKVSGSEVACTPDGTCC